MTTSRKSHLLFVLGLTFSRLTFEELVGRIFVAIHLQGMQSFLFRCHRIHFGKDVVLLVFVSIGSVLFDETKDQQTNNQTEQKQTTDGVGKIRDEHVTDETFVRVGWTNVILETDLGQHRSNRSLALTSLINAC